MSNLPTWLDSFEKILDFIGRSDSYNYLLDPQNNKDCTPLHVAVLANQDSMCTALVRAGKTEPSYPTIPLMILGAPLNSLDTAGMTPLNWCYFAGRHDLAAQMLTLSKDCQATSHEYRPKTNINGDLLFTALLTRTRTNATVTRVIDPKTRQEITEVMLHLPPPPPRTDCGPQPQQQC